MPADIHDALSHVAARLGPFGSRLHWLETATSTNDVAARLDTFDVTGALERIWEVVRALNREVETTAPWQLAKDEARADDYDAIAVGTLPPPAVEIDRTKEEERDP